VKRAEIKAGVKKKSACPRLGNKVALLGVLIVAAVIVLAVIYLNTSTSPGKTGGKEKPGATPAVTEIMASALESLAESKSGTANAQMTISVTSPGAGGQGMTADMEAVLEYDTAGKRMKSVMTANVMGQEQATETYLINGTQYIKMASPMSSQPTWFKMETGAKVIDPSQMDVANLMGLVDGELLGEETLNGKQVYKLSVKPDVRGLMDEFIAGQDLPGVTPGQIDEVMGQIVDSIKKLDATAWVLKDSYVLVRVKGSVSIEMDIGKAYGVQGMGTMVMDGDFTVDLDFDKPVNIQLPAEALDAEEIPVYAMCGDGVCGAGEDETTCPDDCSEELCVDLCGDGECDEVVCLGAGCPCAETASRCPQDCTSGGGEKGVPVCDAIGSRSEGWYDSVTGDLILWANCKDCVAEAQWRDVHGDPSIMGYFWVNNCTEDIIKLIGYGQDDVPKCKPEGSTVAVVPGNECCAGLDAINPGGMAGGECQLLVGASICSQCGNENCEPWENGCNCAEDC